MQSTLCVHFTTVDANNKTVQVHIKGELDEEKKNECNEKRTRKSRKEANRYG